MVYGVPVCNINIIHLTGAMITFVIMSANPTAYDHGCVSILAWALTSFGYTLLWSEQTNQVLDRLVWYTAITLHWYSKGLLTYVPPNINEILQHHVMTRSLRSSDALHVSVHPDSQASILRGGSERLELTTDWHSLCQCQSEKKFFTVAYSWWHTHLCR